jgi:serine/threonine protein kinase
VREENKPFSEEFIYYMFSQLIFALFYYHSLNIILRDMKSVIITITNDNQIKLIDFGMDKEVESKKMFKHNL